MKCKDFIHEYIESKAKPKIEYNLTEAEWKIVEEILATFKIPFETTKMLQNTQCTISDFCGEWLLMKYSIEKQLSTVHSEDENDFTKQLSASVEKFSGQLLSNPMLAAAVFMDPRFTKTLKPTVRTLAISKLTKIYQRFRNQTAEQPPKPNDENNNGKRIDRLEEMLAAAENQDESPQIQTTETEEEKIHRLLQEFSQLPREKSSTDVLKYWEKNQKTKPELFILSQIVLFVPPTQIPTERSFSKFNHIYQPRRSNLDSKLLEDILLINLNKDLFENVVRERVGSE